MGKSFLADIPGNFFKSRLGSHASAASSDANARLADMFWVAPANIQILSAWRQVQANEATHGTAFTSASYRRITIVGGGASGTGTTILASYNGTNSAAQYGTQAFSAVATPTAAAGDILYASQLTVGGADNDGTVLAAGTIDIAYQLL